MSYANPSHRGTVGGLPQQGGSPTPTIQVEDNEVVSGLARYLHSKKNKKNSVDRLKFVLYNVDILIRRKVMRESDQELLLIVVVLCVIVVSVFSSYTPIV